MVSETLVPLLNDSELRMLLHLAKNPFDAVCGPICRVLIGHGLAEQIIKPGLDLVQISEAGRRFLAASP